MTGSRAPGRLAALREFLHEEAVAGVVLLLAAVAALIWANSPAGDEYVDLWHHTLTLGVGRWSITEDLSHWVNDGLMTVFFFVVGLEIKRELAVGELRSRQAAMLPALAALGGVVLPALIFLLLTPGGEARSGWGIPMATDIAFAVGVLALLGRRASPGAKLLLLSIAIVDDIIAIVVIAAFYSGALHWAWFGLAMLTALVIASMRRWLASPWAYVLPALVLWVAVLESGVHATIAGVVLGLLTPAGPVRARMVLEDLEHALHPISAFVVIPIFALTNAGVYLRGGVLGAALRAPLTWAVVVGLVVGKLLGIAAAAGGARRLGWGVVPAQMPPAQIWPVAALGGIGFTVALFIADLAFTDTALITEAKIGIFAGSLIAALLGVGLSVLTGRPGPGSRYADAPPE